VVGAALVALRRMLVATGGIPKTLGVSVGSGLVIAIAMGGSRCPTAQ